MNRKICFYVFFLILLLNAGCGDGTYVAEKMYFHANMKFYSLQDKIKQNNLTDEEINEVILSFKEIILKYPYWEKTPEVYFKIAKLREKQKKYDAAITEYEAVCKNFPQKEEICAEALRSIAAIYTLENNWEKAEQIYELILKDYKFTLVGLFTPVYLAEQYKKRGDTPRAEIMYIDAINFYKQTIKKDINEATMLMLMDLLVTCYNGLGKFDEAIEYLESLAQKHSGSVIQARGLYLIANIFEKNLKKRQKAIQYYKKLIENFSDLKIAEMAKAKLLELKESF